MSAQVAKRVVIRGKVHGVGFRYWTSVTARDLGLEGWVRNRVDGSVEAVMRGPSEAVEEMLRACHRGPPEARVESVQAHDAAHDAAVGEAGQGGFEQRETV